MPGLYYLLPDRKKEIQNYLTSTEREIDPLLSDFIDRVNRYADFATTQCCQGHPERGIEEGYVSILVSERVAQGFEEEMVPWFVEHGVRVEKTYECVPPKLDKPTARFVFWFDAGEREEFCAAFLEWIDVLARFRFRFCIWPPIN